MAAKQSCRHVFCVPYASSVELNKEAQCGRLQEITTGRTSFIEKGISKMAVTFAKSGSDQLIPYHFFNLGCNCSVDHGTEGRGRTPLPPAGAPPLIGEAMSAPLSGELSAQPTEGFHSCFLIDEAPCIPLRLNNYLHCFTYRFKVTTERGPMRPSCTCTRGLRPLDPFSG